MKAIKEKYKDDKQKQQQAMAELWKKHKINPVGGCLPLIVQIPVFIALFTVLRSAIELRFSKFLWISDLSEPEHLFNLGFSIPFLGEYFNLLPVLMAVTMWLQQKMTPSTGDAQQQKMMAVFMPIMIFVMLYNFPSGLILYWTTNQIATIVGQAVSRRRHAGDKAPA
jgi:YidC/Oxa1 family membrane protein insertase